MLARSVMSHARPMAGPQLEMPVPATPMPRPYLSVISFAVACAASCVQIDADDVRAFLDEPVRGFLADAAARADDDDDLPREFLFRRHALQLRFLEQPVFDVERLLLRQRDVLVDRLRAAHDLDGAVVKFRRDARFALVLAPGDHAQAGDQDRPSGSGRAWRANWRACTFRNRRRNPCDTARDRRPVFSSTPPRPRFADSRRRRAA